MANEPIPVYVFTGFLESGKTKFIQDILADPNFTENERTVLLHRSARHIHMSKRLPH